MLAPQIVYIPRGQTDLIFIGNFFFLPLVASGFFKAFSDKNYFR
jgi:hypothetical protein